MDVTTQTILEHRARGMRFKDISQAVGLTTRKVMAIIYEQRRISSGHSSVSVQSDLLHHVMKRVIVTTKGCWEHQGPKRTKGYAETVFGKKRRLAHRVMYELANGPIAPGMCVCHTCDNPPCCNPAHLWLGTKGQNTADMHRKRRSRNAQTTHCAKQHEFTPENTRWTVGPYGPKRHCIQCERDRHRKTPITL